MDTAEIRDGLRDMGPAWLAGAIAAGPATIGSLVLAARFGYDLLWVVLLSAPAGFVGLLLAARLGTFTEQGIVATVEDRLGEGWAWLLVADTVIVSMVAQLLIMFTLAAISAQLLGLSTEVWAVVWAVVLAVGLAGGGYRVAEVGAKLVVTAVVLVFIATLVVVPPDPGAAVGGLVPSVPSGSATAITGVLGGAVHVTLLTMHTYTMRAREWDADDYGLAKFDAGASMLVAFGLYSIAIFLVVAGTLGGQAVTPTAGAAAAALEPVVGEAAVTLFLVGILGAAVSTLGGNTVVPPFLVADKLGWGTTVEDARYRGLLAATALISAAGGFVTGNFVPLLAQALVIGAVGTPFALALVLYLLHLGSAERRPSTALTAAGLAVFAIVSLAAGNSVREMVVGLMESVTPVAALSVLFAAVVGVATVALGAKFVLRRGESPAAEPAD
ncbi:NRAMP family divalent metal transporter [Haloglomus litoreum]|uniref:NRAMP family divalent metal transporter n=1 Tax=Haloglomus litoreum TaxID=3034026 RepID=UPI0023E8EA17|nr:divalent metal cation transporter [Haloglomus sp. DT116]